MSNPLITCNIAIVGGGTAGLALATELRRLGVMDVVVLERESEAGGVPRHCGHYPFGVRERKRLMKGPDYARVLVRDAQKAGVDIRTQTSVTKLHKGARLSLATKDGLLDLQAKRVVLCTGVRESSRAQRFISGQRPMGVMTTGALQSMVYLHQKRPFRRPVILGSELVSLSAIMTCAHMGIKPVVMLEQNTRLTAPKIMRPYPALCGIPLRFGVQNLRIVGGKTVEAVQYSDTDGTQHEIETDGVIVTGQFRPEAALLHDSHIDVDPATGGPSVDQFGRTSDPQYFSTGNLLRPVETSSWCWHEATTAAHRIADDLRDPLGDCPALDLRATDDVIRFVMPQRLVQTDRTGGMEHMQIRLNQPATGYLSALSAGKCLWSDFIQSRPERRILAPLSPLLGKRLTAPVEMKILNSN